MIPFPILHGELIFKNSASLETAVIELSPDHILIRLPNGYFEKNGKPESIILYFFIHKQKKYEKLVLNSGSFSINESENEKYASYYEIKINDDRFSYYSRILSAEYLRYIDLKLYSEDHEMSNAMTYGRYPDNREEEYMISPDDNEAEWTSEFLKNGQRALKEKKLFYSLELPLKQKEFLKKGKEGFSFDIGKRISFDGIVIGNSFCTELFPDMAAFTDLINKASSEDLQVMISVPPVSETVCGSFFERISEMITFLKTSANEERPFVFQFADPGMLMAANDAFNDNQFITFEKGVLLCKSRRDPRRKYLALKNDNDINNLMFSDRTVFGPYYQTNTGTFCPLHALIETGSRGRQTRVANCEKYCEKYYLRYPDHLMMKGEGNSLFGFYDRFLLDDLSFTFFDFHNIERVVINI